MMTVAVPVTDWRGPDLLLSAAMAPAPSTGLESAELLLPLATAASGYLPHTPESNDRGKEIRHHCPL